MQLLESKSLLAKLMATENLVVEQRNVPTACFDVKNRVLTIPVLDKNISGYLYDLFVGHEVGHALYTPVSGLLRAKELKIPQSISNVIEDVRIEKKVKYKYPGLRSSFTKAYVELTQKNFFGTNGVDLNELNFVDRVNMHSKGGAMLGIRFSAEERNLLNEIEATESYDDVLVVAQKVLAFMKQKEEERKANAPDSEDYEDGDDGEDFANEWDDDFGDETEEGDETESGSKQASDDYDDGEDEDTEVIGNDDRFEHKEIEEDNVRAFTDEAFKQNEKKLFAENASNYMYGNIPKFDIKKGILSYKELYSKIDDEYSRWSLNFDKAENGQYAKLRRDTNKVVSYLVKEFELRKNADQLKRASTAKTGDLDMKKIFSYQFNDDIFKKISVVPNGKSHGLVMFLDWSGSMHDHLANTMKQLISLVMFCKKVNIPYDVYAFASPESFGSHQYEITPKKGDIASNPFYLMNLLSSRMSAGEFTKAAKILTFMANNQRYTPTFMAMGGTPLNEAVIAAMEIIPAFQKQYKLQVVNSVFLTDGEGHTLRQTYDQNTDGRLHRIGKDYGVMGKDFGLIIRDPLTKHQEIVDNIYNCANHTGAYVKLLKARTNCNVLGFYVISGREFGRKIYDFYPRTANYDTIKASFRKTKFAVVTTAGFDEYYVLRSEALDTEEDNTFEVKENATTRGLVSAFSKYAGGRVANRVVLNRFIGMIA
jgi:hypothetical protein